MKRPQMTGGLPRRNGPDWFRISNAASEAADVYIYDVIGYDFWTDGGITAKDFVDQLGKVKAKAITLHVNSPGGDVFDGLAIYNALRDHPATVTTRVEGLAASAASWIALAGDAVLMAPHAMLMIHRAASISFGNAEDMRKAADTLEKIDDNIAGFYADKAGGGRAKWLGKMTDETWFTDAEAVGAGLADRIDDGAPAPTNSFDLSVFRHPPAPLAGATDHHDDDRVPTVRDAERALRDAGYSRTAAKAFLASRDEPARDAPGTERLLAGLAALRG